MTALERIPTHERLAPVAVTLTAAQERLHRTYDAVTWAAEPQVRRQAGPAHQRQTRPGGQLDRLLNAEQAPHLPAGSERVDRRIANRQDTRTGQHVVNENELAARSQHARHVIEEGGRRLGMDERLNGVDQVRAGDGIDDRGRQAAEVALVEAAGASQRSDSSARTTLGVSDPQSSRWSAPSVRERSHFQVLAS